MVSPGPCTKCRNYQTPDKNLFTNTWIGGSDLVSKWYLTYKWFLSVITLIFLAESVYKRVIKESDWRYCLYLTSWGRLLAVFHYSLEAVLVTLRWRRELNGLVELSVRESYAASSVSPLPFSHRILWILANINANVSLVSTLVYWPFFYQAGVHPLDLQNLSGHALITIINILDVVISNRPWRCLHAYHSQLFCLVYALSNFAYIEEEGTGIYASHYMYSILDWSKPTQCLLTVLGLSILIPFLHLSLILIYKLRCSVEAVQKRRRGNPDKQQIELGRIHLVQRPS